MATFGKLRENGQMSYSNAHAVALRTLMFCLLTAMSLALRVVSASGAEIRDTKFEEMTLATTFASLIFEGKVEIGDYDKLLRKIDEDCGLGVRFCPDGIFLASPGGDLAEAMKIGRLVRKLGLETHVPGDLPAPYRQEAEASLKDAKANYLCASACFFIFVGGIDREGDFYPDTYPPILGIHRPYLSESGLRKLSGDQVIAVAQQTRLIVEEYLKEMGVSAKYADLMFSIPKDRVRMIDKHDFDSDFKGYIPEIQDWLDAKCPKNPKKDVEETIRNRNPSEESMQGASRSNAFDERWPSGPITPTLRPGQCRLQTLNKFRADAWKQFRGE